MSKLIWFEKFIVTCEYNTEITEEEVQLFNEDDEDFFLCGGLSI